MSDDRIVQLLEEMLALQRRHVASYQEALRNQAESIRIQKEMQDVAIRRLRVIPFLVGVVLILAAFVVWRIVAPMF